MGKLYHDAVLAPNLVLEKNTSQVDLPSQVTTVCRSWLQMVAVVEVNRTGGSAISRL